MDNILTNTLLPDLSKCILGRLNEKTFVDSLTVGLDETANLLI